MKGRRKGRSSRENEDLKEKRKKKRSREKNEGVGWRGKRREE